MTSDNQKIVSDEFFEAVLKLKTVDECKAFFDDVCTVNEINAIKQRYTVASLLAQNKVYKDIIESTGASTATISRVRRSLMYGGSGYNIVFDRLGYKKDESE